MSDTTLWSTTAATNASADPSINWAEGQAPGTVNDSARNMMAVLAMRWLDESGFVASGGSSTAYTVTPQQTLTAYRDGLTIGFRAHAACGATPTLNVSSLGAKALRNRANGVLAANEIASGAFVKAVYSSTLDTFLVVNQNVYSELAAVLQAGAFYGKAIGEITDYSGTTAPAGHLLCYGQAISRTTYASLWTFAQTEIGAGNLLFTNGNGSTTFTIPDLRGSTTSAPDNMGGSDALRLTNATTVSGNKNTIGGRLGEGVHALVEASLPSIAPIFVGTPAVITVVSNRSDVDCGTSNSGNHTGSGQVVGVASSVALTSTGNHTPAGAVSSFGSGGSHNNVQPTLMINKMIFAGV